MTKQQSGADHDPFAYGQLQLGSNQGSESSDPSPDDVLFEAGEATEAVFGNDAAPEPEDWGLMQSDLEDLLPGSGSPALGPPLQPPAAAEPTATDVASPVSAQPGPEPAAASPRPAAAQPRAAPRGPTTPMPARQQGRPAAAVVPWIVLIAGATVGAYNYLVIENEVFAGIAGALGVIGAAFSWVLLRR